MNAPKQFGTLLQMFLQREDRSTRWVERQTAEQLGDAHRVSYRTVSSWVGGEIKTRPSRWQDIVRVAIVLRLTEQETDQLLQAASYAPLNELRDTVTETSDQELLAYEDNQPQATAKIVGPPQQIPTHTFHFVRRGQELRDIRTAILGHAQGVCLCYLYGMGGVGKTSLAVEAAQQLAGQFPDGVLWAELHQSDPMSILLNFGMAYGHDLSHYHDVSTRSSKFREILSGRRVLLVLDNAEHDGQIRPLLPPASSACAVIITSRRHDLSVADTARRLAVRPFRSEEDSLAVLAQILEESYVRRERRALKQIAELVGHLPLALNIVANRLKLDWNWTPAKMLARLQTYQLDVLVRSEQQVRASFDVSHEMLAEHLQSFWVSLGVFNGLALSVKALAAVNDVPIAQAEENVRQLLNYSLVQIRGDERFRLHPLLHEYCLEKVAGEGEYWERLVDFFLHDIVLGEVASEAVWERELGLILHAVEVAVERGRTTAVVSSVLALSPYLQRRGLYEVARQLLVRAQAIVADEVHLGQIYGHLGRILMRQGKAQSAREHVLQALEIAERLQAIDEVMRLLTRLGALATRQGRLEEARAYYQRAMTYAEERQDRRRTAILLNNLGMVVTDEGDYGRAESYYRQGLAIAQEIGDQGALTITILQSLGRLLEEQGNYSAAQVYLQEGLALAEQRGDPELRSRLLSNLGLVAYGLRNYAEAVALFRKGYAIADKHGLEIERTRQLANLGLAETARQEYRQAHLHYRQALTLAEGLGFPTELCAVLNGWGACYLAQQELQRAEELFARVPQVIEEEGRFQNEVAHSLYGLAQVARWQGHLDKARALGQQSLDLFEAIQHVRVGEVRAWLAELPHR